MEDGKRVNSCLEETERPGARKGVNEQITIGGVSLRARSHAERRTPSLKPLSSDLGSEPEIGLHWRPNNGL